MLGHTLEQVIADENDRVFLVCGQLSVAKFIGGVQWRVPFVHFNHFSINSVLFPENLSHLLKILALFSSPLHKAKLLIRQIHM